MQQRQREGQLGQSKRVEKIACFAVRHSHPNFRKILCNIEGRPFGVGVDACSLRSDRRQGSKPASRRSARASLRVLDCVLAPATVLSSGSWRSPLLRCAQFLFYEFSLVPEGHAASKKSLCEPRSAEFFGKDKGAPLCGVNFECCFNLSPLRKERSR